MAAKTTETYSSLSQQNSPLESGVEFAAIIHNNKIMHNFKLAKLILKTTSTPKSVFQISSECGISLTHAYRSVKELYGCNLLKPISCSINNGKKCFLYKSKTVPDNIVYGMVWS